MILLQPLAPMSKLQNPAAFIFKLCQKTGRAIQGAKRGQRASNSF